MTPRDDETPQNESREEPTREESPQERQKQSPRSRQQSSEANPEHDRPLRAGSARQQESEEPSEMVLFARDIVVSVLAVALIGGYIFMISGVWPPMVAIESGSMEPNMDVNDLVFVMDSDRFQPESAHGETGVVPAAVGTETGYEQYGGSGDVIVFNPQGNERVTPIIHRAMFWVDEGENWYDRTNKEYIGNANSCAQLVGCPAPHAGFITKGDNNPTYDQSGNGRLDPVKDEWIVGTAEVRIPGVGWLRLQF